MSDTSLLRFLGKLKELVWPKLSAMERDQFNRMAAGHAGGKAKADAMKSTGEDAIWAKVNKTAKGGCWEWTGASNDRGYPYIWVNGEARRAHRVVFELVKGTLKDGFQVHHKCGNTLCVNPAHMEQLNGDDHAKAEEPKTFPYKTVGSLPESVRDALPAPAQRVWMAAFNNTIDGGNEAQATRIAWGAVKNFGWKKGEDGKWVRANEDGIDAIVMSLEGANMNVFPLLAEISLKEDEATVQIFPEVGSYKHPKYGEIKVTDEFLNRIKANFDKKVYQQDLPVTVDLEHETKLSGANAWIKGLEHKGKDGMWATLGFTDRGKQLVKEDRYRYFSPEFYDKWVDPASNKEYHDLLIGGALTNRPFFKGMDAVMMMREDGLFLMGELDPTVRNGDDVTQGNGDDVTTTTTDATLHDGNDVNWDFTFAEMKIEDGQQYPAAAYLVVLDATKPSEWKLRIWETPELKVTKTQLGRAAAAFSPGGFRGQKVQLSPEDRKSALNKLRQLYAKLDVGPDELPAYIRGTMVEAEMGEVDIVAVLADMGIIETAGGNTMGMTEDETKQLTEATSAIKTLTERLEESDKAKEAAEGETKKALEGIAGLERDARSQRFTEMVLGRAEGSDGARWYGEIEGHVKFLEDLTEKFGPDSDQVKHYISGQQAAAAQLKESPLMKELGSSRVAQKSGTEAEVDSRIRKLTEDNKLSETEARMKVFEDDPALYQKMQNEAELNKPRLGHTNPED